MKPPERPNPEREGLKLGRPKLLDREGPRPGLRTVLVREEPTLDRLEPPDRALPTLERRIELVRVGLDGARTVELGRAAALLTVGARKTGLGGRSTTPVRVGAGPGLRTTPVRLGETRLTVGARPTVPVRP